MVESGCSIYPGEPEKCDTIYIVHKAFSSLSLISSLFVATLILLTREQRVLVHEMILFLAISAFFSSISFLLGNVDSYDSHTCRFQSFMMQYFDWASLLWVLMISINMVFIVKNKSVKKKYVIYHCAVWFSALFWSVIPFFENTYGHAGLWCWIKKDYPGYRFGTWFGPLLLICIAMFCIFIYVIFFVYQSTKACTGHTSEIENMNKIYRSELRPLLFYPLMYIVLTIPTLMYRIDDESKPNDSPNYGLLVIAAIFEPSKGSVNAIIFAVINIGMIRNLTLQRLKNQFVLYFKREKQAQVTQNVELEDQNRNPDSRYQMSTISLD